MATIEDAFVTVQEVKTRFDISSTTEDNKIEMLINSATDFVQKYCGRKFKERTWTEELYDGENTNRIFLRDYPISDASADAPVILIDDVAVDVEAINYRTGMLELASIACEEIGNIKATYKAGYADADIPFDLKEAVMQIVGRARTVGKSLGIASESVGDYSVTYANDRVGGSITNEIRSILTNYKRR